MSVPFGSRPLAVHHPVAARPGLPAPSEPPRTARALEVLWPPLCERGHPGYPGATCFLSLCRPARHLGTIFLWTFWPSFNSAPTMLGDGQHRTTLNTYYSLTASTLSTFALSALVGEHGRLDMVRERALGGQRDGRGEEGAETLRGPVCRGTGQGAGTGQGQEATTQQQESLRSDGRGTSRSPRCHCGGRGGVGWGRRPGPAPDAPLPCASPGSHPERSAGRRGRSGDIR